MGLKDFQHENLQARWKIINEVVLLAKQERSRADQPIEGFKIDRKQLKGYLDVIAQNLKTSSDELIQDFGIVPFENSIIVLGDRTILMDHNPGSADYKARYAGFGAYGKVKQGIDENGKLYAIKIERKRDMATSEKEQQIMLKTGNLIGTLDRQTSTAKLWLDKKPIQEKEMTIMPWIEGKSLRELDTLGLQNAYPQLTAQEREQLLYIIALGTIKSIERLNNMGVAHRDIKADNFLVDLNHLPSDLSKIDLEDYLEDKDPNCQFSKLVTAVDFGLSIEVPPDGTSVSVPISERARATNTTAPEYFTDAVCSIHSDAFQIPLLLNHFFHINTSEISTYVYNLNLIDRLGNYVTALSSQLQYQFILDRTNEILMKIDQQIADEKKLPEPDLEKLGRMYAAKDTKFIPQKAKVESELRASTARVENALAPLVYFRDNSSISKPEDRPTLNEYFQYLKKELLKKSDLILSRPAAASSTSSSDEDRMSISPSSSSGEERADALLMMAEPLRSHHTTASTKKAEELEDIVIEPKPPRIP